MCHLACHRPPDTCVPRSYLLEMATTNPVVTVQAPSVFGAMYGLETFSQLLVDGQLGCSFAFVQDAPMYRHRGLLVDSGRRFAPVGMLKGLMDAMVGASRVGASRARALVSVCVRGVCVACAPAFTRRGHCATPVYPKRVH